MNSSATTVETTSIEEQRTMHPTDIFMYSFASVLMVLSLIAMFMTFAYYRRSRMLTHTERLKAMELGRELPEDAGVARLKAVFAGNHVDDEGEPTGEDALAHRCFKVAFWVPLAAFGATQASDHFRHGVELAVWGAVAVITATSLICGTILALKSPGRSARQPAPTPLNGHAKHLEQDPDAYDVASRRG
jgi:hypothetical protein